MSFDCRAAEGPDRDVHRSGRGQGGCRRGEGAVPWPRRDSAGGAHGAALAGPGPPTPRLGPPGRCGVLFGAAKRGVTPTDASAREGRRWSHSRWWGPPGGGRNSWGLEGRAVGPKATSPAPCFYVSS
jgi:hypothetical protein